MKRARYIFDREIFEQNITNLRDACACAGLKTILAYSVKTNSHRAVLDAAREAGMYAEVVSPHEYALAVECGFPLNKIVYNGVIPDPAGKAEVAAGGGIVNIENLNELNQINRKAYYARKEITVGIRICPDVRNGIQSRFGVVYMSEEYIEMVMAARCSDFLSISGIHCHSTSARDLERWERKVRQVARIAKELGVRYIDLGSNFYGPMDPRMAVQFGNIIPGFKDYAQLIASVLSAVYGNDPDTWPEIILEPGTPVIANAVSIEAEVMNVRETNGRVIANVNCSVYDCGFAYLSKQIPFDIEHMSRGKNYTDVDICGNTCVEIDRLYKGYSGELAIGDKVTFRNLGAYSLSMSNWFIEPPLEFVVKNGGNDGVSDDKMQRDS